MKKIKRLEKEIELLQKKLEIIKEIKEYESREQTPYIPYIAPIFDHLYRPNEITYTTCKTE
jgi:hypothetical protein